MFRDSRCSAFSDQLGRASLGGDCAPSGIAAAARQQEASSSRQAAAGKQQQQQQQQHRYSCEQL